MRRLARRRPALLAMVATLLLASAPSSADHQGTVDDVQCVGTKCVGGADLSFGNLDVLVDDPGFERGAAGARAWTQAGQGPTFELLRDPALARTGAGLARRVGDGTTAGIRLIVNGLQLDVRPGDGFLAEAHAQSVGANGAALVAVQWLNASSTSLAASAFRVGAGAAAGAYVRVGGLAVAPAGAVFARVRVQVNNHTQGTWLIDDVSLVTLVPGARLADASVAEEKLSFNPATQAELDLHLASGDHDARYPTRGEPATDVQCTACVHASDVAAGAVAGGPAGALADGTITVADLANLAVTTAKIADLAVTTPKIADGAVTTAKLGFDPATQAELDAFSPRLAFGLNTTRVVDDANAGDESSMTVGADGRPIIVYRKSSQLWFARCADLTCTESPSFPSTVALDTTATRGPSVAIGSDRLPIISYTTVDGVVVLHCGTPDCAPAGRVRTGHGPAAAPHPDQPTSIAIDPGGRAVVTYIGADDSVKFLRCTSVVCNTSPSIATIDACCRSRTSRRWRSARTGYHSSLWASSSGVLPPHSFASSTAPTAPARRETSSGSPPPKGTSSSRP